MARSLKIVYATSEVQPYAKSGGLADVSSALPGALRRLGHDIRIFLPKYKSVESTKQPIRPLGLEINVPVGINKIRATLSEGKLDNQVPIYFLDHSHYYNRDSYYGESGYDYSDNAERFIFFCRGILESCKSLGFRPDIIHCSDWQTGLIPAYIKVLYNSDPFFKNTKTIFSIHNLGYQGNFHDSVLPLAHLPWTLYNQEGVEFYGEFSFLKTGLVFSDSITTVSPTYSKEIQTPEHGFRMDGVLRHRQADLHGILNGVEYEIWDPEIDSHIPKNYSISFPTGKKECKSALLKKLNLNPDLKKPLFCMITRLSSQKGIKLIVEILPWLLKQKANFVMLGSGEQDFENFFSDKSQEYPNNVSCTLGFNEKLAHEILAGSDFLFMPSLYEPCGLTQMYALRYGTVPIVRAVGGLKDTIKPFDYQSGEGTGFLFHSFELKYLIQAVQLALFSYKDRGLWRQLVKNGMSQDNSWTHSAKLYESLYNDILNQ